MYRTLKIQVQRLGQKPETAARFLAFGALLKQKWSSFYFSLKMCSPQALYLLLFVGAVHCDGLCTGIT